MITLVDPLIVIVLSDLARALRAMEIQFCVIGALVPELLLNAQPSRFTKDADVTVILDSLDEFERLKQRLSDFGFEPTRWLYRMTHRGGGWADLLPYSAKLAPDGQLRLGRDLSFNMIGFDRVMPNAIQVSVTPELSVPVTPIPLYVLLKLLAFGDRKNPKDPSGVLYCLRHYADEDERRFGLDHHDQPVPYEFTTAYLLGQDGRGLHDPPLAEAAGRVLDQFHSPEAAAIDIAAREDAGGFIDDDCRRDVFDMFRWFRAGAGL